MGVVSLFSMARVKGLYLRGKYKNRKVMVSDKERSIRTNK